MNIQKILKTVTLGALFLIPFFPLIVANSFFFPFITGKAFYFRILVELAFAGWFILAFLDAKYRPRFNWLTVGVTLFTLITLVADLTGVAPLRSLWSNFERMEGWLAIVHLWAFFMVAVNMFGADGEGRQMWHRWFNVSLVVSVIIALYSFGQLFGWLAIHQGSVRLDATLGNAAYLAVYMLFSFFLVAYMFLVNWFKGKNKSQFILWAYPIVAIIYGFIILQTQTRGTILGLIGGIMIALFLYAIFAKKESKKSRWISAGILGLIILIGVLFWFNRSASFIQSSPVLQRIASISLKDTQTQARAYVWPMAIEGFKERPILGWGQENFNYVFNANYTPKMWAHEQWFDRTHSVYLDWLVASGVLGLLAYLALYVIFIIMVWKSNLPISEKSVLTGLVVGYAVHNIFVFDSLASYVLFFAMLGFATACKHEKGIHDKSMFGQKALGVDAVEYIVAPIVIILFISSLYFLNIRTIQANTRMITALVSCQTQQPDPKLFERVFELNQYVANQEAREQVFPCATNLIRNPNVPNTIKQGYFNLATDAIQAQTATTPKDARIFVLGGTFLNNAGQVSLSESLLERAMELSPGKQSIKFELATSYLNNKKTDKAVELLRQAYEDAPEYPEARSAYALGLIIEGNENEARRIFKNDPSIFESTALANIYNNLKQYSKAINIYKSLITKDPKNVNLVVTLAQIQFTAGMKWEAVQTLKKAQVDYPEYKTQIDDMIKQIEK